MRVHFRVSLVALVVSALIALAAPVAAQAAFGFQKWFAANCNAAHKTCNLAASESEEKEKAEEEGFTQAGGHPNFGISDFTLETYEPTEHNVLGQLLPEGNVSVVRVDVAPGVVTNPQAVPKCSMEDFTSTEVAEGVYFGPTCPASSIIGENEVETAVILEEGPFAGNIFDATLVGKVYNLEQPTGLGSDFGVALPLGKEVAGKELYAHTLIEGSVEWAGDYHDYFVIKNIPPGLIKSRLTFTGNIGTGFLTNPSTCDGPGPQTTTTIHAESAEGEKAQASYEAPIGNSGCDSLPFGPTLEVTPENSVSDQPDGLTAELKMPHNEEPEGIDSSDLKTAKVTLPEGVSMNPSAAAGLEACTAKQAGFGPETRALEVQKLNPSGCPGRAKVGTVSLNVPTLPEDSLRGSIYLGQEENTSGEAEPIIEPPYTIFLDARSSRYGIRVLLKGTVAPDLTTGQLTATFDENPQGPFDNVTLHFNGGPFAPLANPLVCGTSATAAELTSFTGTELPLASPFTTTGCTSSSPPFAPTQGTGVTPSTGGANSNFTFTLTRPEGQQYLKQVSTVLPPGLVGKIPTVPLCSEALSKADECPATSQIGTVRATAGSGEPYAFNGTVYLTGPYNGAPYGLLFAVPVVAGPFDLGIEYVHAKIEVNPNTARVTVTTDDLPAIRDGIPTRLRSMTVDVDRPNYILNPTNCGLLASESTVTSTMGATALVSSPFQAEGCSGLAFTPKFAASTGAKHSKADGASLVTTLTQAPGQANVKSVLVTLPKQLPSRLTTLQKACLAKTFEENPYNCATASPGSEVGTATALTPVLPNTMKGPAFLVSHGGEAFPSLELVLEADGVRVIVEGKTHIKNGITTTFFESTPDVPVSSITVNLPLGPHSALATETLKTNLCKPTMVMPTVITGQNGKQVKYNTPISPTGCGVQIVGHKVIGRTLYLTVKTFAAGRISATGRGLRTTRRRLAKAHKRATLKVPLSRRGRARRRPFKIKVRVGFLAKKGHHHSAAHVKVRFR